MRRPIPAKSGKHTIIVEDVAPDVRHHIVLHSVVTEHAFEACKSRPPMFKLSEAV